MTTLLISIEEIDVIIKMFISLEEYGLLIKDVGEKIKIDAKDRKVGFLACYYVH